MTNLLKKKATLNKGAARAIEAGLAKQGAVAEPAALQVPKIHERSVVISPPNFQYANIEIVGTAPYVQHKFSEKSRKQMEATQRAGSQAKKGKKRDPRDFEGDVERAKHFSHEGWVGIPAPAFRNAMISACKVCGFAMTRAKLSVFVIRDGLDADDGTPLVRIYGDPVAHEMTVRNESGVADIRWRPMWKEWSAIVRVRWDGDQFSQLDIAHLMLRAGMQVGVGEGRPDSPNSNGLDWGTWELKA